MSFVSLICMTVFCNMYIMSTKMRALEALFETRHYATICTSSHSLGQFSDHILIFLVTIALYNLTILSNNSVTILSNNSVLQLKTALLFTTVYGIPIHGNYRFCMSSFQGWFDLILI
jgi:hypothetical protein